MKKSIAVFLYVMLLFMQKSIVAQCLMREVSMNERVAQSSNIVEGKVIGKRSYWDEEHNNIYTIQKVKIYKNFKGTLHSNEIDVVTLGGELDNLSLYLSPSFTLNKDDEGVFLLNPTDLRLSGFGNTGTIYETYAYSQGFLKRDVQTNTFSDIFHTYPDENNVYTLLATQTNQSYVTIEERPLINNDISNRITAPSITSFTPTTLNAGTLTDLVINGTNFGNRTGSATVQFRNPDAAFSIYYSPVPSIYIKSWTNTQIKVTVPGDGTISGVGTGLFRVVDSSGAIATSSSNLTVNYNQNESDLVQMYFVNISNGGYKLNFNDLFYNNVAARTAFTRALQQWKCKTGINVYIDAAKTTTFCANYNDNVNTVSFDSSTCSTKLPAGVLGRASFAVASCGPNFDKRYLQSVDVVFSKYTNWSYDTIIATSDQYDFESVALHELGHAFGQGHVLNANEVMYPSLFNNQRNAILKPTTDIANVSNILGRSNFSGSICTYTKHILVTTSCNLTTSVNNDQKSIDKLSVFPNPANGTINVDMMLTHNDNVNLQLISIGGEVLFEQQLNNVRAYNNKIDLSSFSDAIYFLKISTNDDTVYKKIIVTH